MKKLLLFSVLFVLLLVCIVLSTPSTPVLAASIEKIVRSHPGNIDPVKNKKSLEENELGIHNVVPGPVLDNDLDGACVSYYLNIKVKVPEEGAFVQLIYYHRTKDSVTGEWGEFVLDFTGEVWFFTKIDSVYIHIEYYNYLAEAEEGHEPLAPSRAEFRVDMNPIDGDLNNPYDTFVPKQRRYWRFPVIESGGQDGN